MNKSLYGLKQAHRAWFDRFTTHLLSLGFMASQADTSLFYKVNGSVFVFLLLYVDDILISGNNACYIEHLICCLQREFEMTNLGNLQYFLGLEVNRTPTSLTVRQQKYTTDLLKSIGMHNCKPCLTPCARKVSSTENSSNLLADPLEYRRIVGSLQYLTFTRPEIFFSVNKACQNLHSPTEGDLVAVKRILRYLQGSPMLRLSFKAGSLNLQAFCDSDWAGDPIDRRSTTGFAVFLGPNLISWSAKKQPTVARSTTKAEYRSLASTTAELCWVRQILDFQVPILQVPTLWSDNISAISLANNPLFHARTKHIEIDYHFVREKATRKDIQINYITSVDQIGDIFTKPLAHTRFLYLRSKLCLQETSV